MRNKILVLAMAAAGVAFSGASVAATQGTVGATSSGSVVITATIPKLIRITDLADITVDVAAATTNADGYAADATGSSDACVRQNSTTATYGIKATSLNGSFVLKSGTLTVPYTLSWGVTDLTYNTALTTQTPDSTSLGSCTPVTDKLGVKITAANLNTAEGSTTAYTDTVTLLVTPD